MAAVAPFDPRPRPYRPPLEIAGRFLSQSCALPCQRWTISTWSGLSLANPRPARPASPALRTATPELDRPRYTGGSTGAPQPVRITPRMLLAQLQTYAELLQTRGVLAAGSVAAAGGAEPAWTSLHLFLNFALHDLSLGACALLHPMGLTRPADSVCPVALHHIAMASCALPQPQLTRLKVTILHKVTWKVRIKSPSDRYLCV